MPRLLSLQPNIYYKFLYSCRKHAYILHDSKMSSPKTGNYSTAIPLPVPSVLHVILAVYYFSIFDDRLFRSKFPFYFAFLHASSGSNGHSESVTSDISSRLYGFLFRYYIKHRSFFGDIQGLTYHNKQNFRACEH